MLPWERVSHAMSMDLLAMGLAKDPVQMASNATSMDRVLFAQALQEVWLVALQLTMAG